MTSRNTFQNSLIQYAGYTGSTGGTVVPIPQATGLQVVGSTAISAPVASISFPVPSTAKSVVVCGKGMTYTGGSLGIFIEDGVSAGFGSEQTLTKDTFFVQCYSYDSKTWVGSSAIGDQSSGDTPPSTTEMIGGTLLANITNVIVQATNGDLTAGRIFVLYS